MPKGRSQKLGHKKKEKVNGSSEDKGRRQLTAVVQGGLDRCPIGEALRKTTGRKARNSLLQAIKACKQGDSCHCKRNYLGSKKEQGRSEEKARAASRIPEES